jgi:MoaA/NifB/PqqE/SkfB family radical SAM enzyme
MLEANLVIRNYYKGGKMAWKALLSNFNALKHPYKLTFAVTYNCNYKCIHCAIWKKTPINELKLDEIQEFTKKSNYISWVNITGGEPFLRKDLFEVIQAFSENSRDLYLLNMTTNSFRPDLIVQKVQEILNLKIPQFMIALSIDGDKVKHEEIRGVENCFEKAIFLYKSLRDLKKDYNTFGVYFSYTSMPQNLGEFEKTFNSVQNQIPDIKPTDFHINLFHHSHHFYNNLDKNESSFLENRLNSYNEFNTIEKNYKNNMRRSLLSFLEDQYLKKAKRFIATRKSPLQCKVIQSSCFLDPSGDVYPCTIFSKKLGNIREYEYDLEKILSAKIVSKIRAKIISQRCPNCWTPCEAYQTILGNFSSVIKK